MAHFFGVLTVDDEESLCRIIPENCKNPAMQQIKSEFPRIEVVMLTAYVMWRIRSTP